jgi:hypothetical protein
MSYINRLYNDILTNAIGTCNYTMMYQPDRWFRFGHAGPRDVEVRGCNEIRNTNHRPCLIHISTHPTFFTSSILPSPSSHIPQSHLPSHVGSACRVTCTDKRPGRGPFTSLRRITCAGVAFAGGGRPQVPHLPAALCQIGTPPSPYSPSHKGTSVCLCRVRQVVRAQVSPHSHMHCTVCTCNATGNVDAWD